MCVLRDGQERIAALQVRMNIKVITVHCNIMIVIVINQVHVKA